MYTFNNIIDMIKESGDQADYYIKQSLVNLIQNKDIKNLENNPINDHKFEVEYTTRVDNELVNINLIVQRENLETLAIFVDALNAEVDSGDYVNGAAACSSLLKKFGLYERLKIVYEKLLGES